MFGSPVTERDRGVAQSEFEAIDYAHQPSHARPSAQFTRSPFDLAQGPRSRRVEVFGPMQLTDVPELAEVQGLGVERRGIDRGGV